MNRPRFIAINFICAIAIANLPVHAEPTAADCAGLAQLQLSGASISSATIVEAGTFKTPEGRAFPKLKAFCRVVASAMPTTDSNIHFEVWLPVADWNGRIWGVGNGNFAGAINYAGLATQLGEMYATVSTDTGHQGKPMETQWANGHFEKIVDFGHRGVHEAIVHAKRIVKTYYKQGASKSYFGSCSNGGRQAMMEALRYPDDYDGIIAGAPASPYTQLFIGSAQSLRTFTDPASRLTPGKIEALRSATLAACDGQDGVKDGIIENPAACKFDVAALACQGAESDQCLTPKQLESVRLLYRGPESDTGQRLFQGFARGSEAAWFDIHFGTDITQSSGYQFANGFYRDFVFGAAAWDLNDYDMKRDGALVDRKFTSVLNADGTDLNAFAKRGGKLILFHGWSDPLLPAPETVAYYQRLKSAIGEAKANESIRLFMAPGVAHCVGGPGADRFGQYDGGSGDPNTSMGAALQRWVEKGIAPERIVAGKLKEANNPAAGFARTHPLCAYPRVAKYKGEGSTDSAENFECKEPD